MHNLHRNIHPNHFTKKRERLEIYIAITLRVIAAGLIGIYIPIYIINELGYPFLNILYFFLVELITILFSSLFVGKISEKLGAKRTMVLSIPFTITYLILLYYATSVPIYLAAFFGGIGGIMYWIPYHLDFSKFSDKKNRGKELSSWFSLMMAASVVGPFLGGYLISRFSFHSVFILASILLFISSIPPLFSKEVHQKVKTNIKNVFTKENMKDLPGAMGFSFATYASAIFWPLFMFLFLDSYFKIGVVVSLTAFGDIFITLWAGKLRDKGKGNFVLRLGVFMTSISFIVRGFLQSFSSFVLLTIFGATGNTLFDVPHHARFYDKSNKHPKKRAEYIIFREMAICMGRIFVLLILLVAFFIFSKLGFVGLDLIKYSLVSIFIASGFLSYLILLY